MKTEYIFTIDKKSDLASQDGFVQLLIDNIQQIDSVVKCITDDKNKIRRFDINDQGKIYHLINCSNDKCEISVCGSQLIVETISSCDVRFAVHVVTIQNIPRVECIRHETIQKKFQKFVCDNLIKFADVKIVWDDISKCNASKTYPEIYDIENLMRNLITKFMVVNIGKEWAKYTPPKLQAKANKRDNTDQLQEFTSILYNLDFIDLSYYLFQQYPLQTDTSILKSKLNQSNLPDIVLDYIDMSNWERYFGKVLKINENDFINKWKKLYGYRCKIAHNKFFTKDDIQATQKLIEKIKRMLENALDILAKNEGVMLPSEDKIAFIRYGITPVITSNLEKIVDVCEKICILKKMEKHNTDTMNFMPATQQHWVILSHLKFYFDSMEMLGVSIYSELRTVHQQCEQFFSGNISEEDENIFANLPDRMNTLLEKMELYYLKEKYNEGK